jgi:CHAD domain-containing protein
LAKAQPLLAVKPFGSLGDNGPQILYTRLSEMMFFASDIADPQNIVELHSMRIAAKRLRYTLEIFEPAYADQINLFQELLEEVKGVQEKLGEIHDSDVRSALLGKYLNQNIARKPEIRPGLQNLIDREHDTRAGMFKSFISYWNSRGAGKELEKQFVQVIFHGRFSAS